MEEIKVSVICNVYNHEKYIRSALEGFVCQKTTFPFEVLVHDDASTDQSADIIREYEMKYPEIVKPIYQTKNQRSQRVPINVVFQEPRVRGKYIAICEGDDYWTDPLKLQKQYDFMEANPEYTLCTCSTQWLNMLSGKVENRGCVDTDRDISLEEIILEKNGRIFQLASFFMKTEIWKNRPEWKKCFPIGDLPMAILSGLNGKVHMLADKMTVYRYYSSGSWTARMDSSQYRADVSKKMIRGFEALNEATDYKYNEVITERILKHKYTLALMERDLTSIRTGELRKIYRSRKLMLRFSDVLRCKFPKLHLCIMRLLKKKI